MLRQSFKSEVLTCELVFSGNLLTAGEGLGPPLVLTSSGSRLAVLLNG